MPPGSGSACAPRRTRRNAPLPRRPSPPPCSSVATTDAGAARNYPPWGPRHLAMLDDGCDVVALPGSRGQSPVWRYHADRGGYAQGAPAGQGRQSVLVPIQLIAVEGGGVPGQGVALLAGRQLVR